MIKRTLGIGDYDTAANLWTLSALKITKGAQVQNFVSVPGRSAPLDLSTVLTDGVPYYDNARLDATLETSEGTRDERELRITDLINHVDGLSLQIYHPDKPGYYLNGRVQITRNYSDLAHSSVAVSAVCEPWFYNMAETTFSNVFEGKYTYYLINRGRLPVVPTIFTGGIGITLTYNGAKVTTKEQEFKLPDLIVPGGGPLHPGQLAVTVEQQSFVRTWFTFREAVIAE